jgi:hypothetical protein
LTPWQQWTVRTWIDGKDPRQFGYESGLWTRTILTEGGDRRRSTIASGRT